jgi:hypothetical protein
LQVAQLKKPFPARMRLRTLNWEKRLMSRPSARKAIKRRARARHLRTRKLRLHTHLHQFLTPQVWKQGHRAWFTPHSDSAWSLKAILWVLLLMTWIKGDSEKERFVQARNHFVVEHDHEKRPGTTWAGFRDALRRLPMAVFRALAAGLRQQLGGRWIDELRVGGWLPMGCDGSRLECPRSESLEKRLGQAGKDDSAPMVYVTALALLPLGLLWAWRLDKGTGSEHRHLTQMLPTLPAQTLLIADACYLGYDLYRAILAADAAFLIRMSSRAYLYTDQNQPLKRFQEGWVHYWPGHAQAAGRPPLRLRLLRVVGKHQAEVWLLTNLDKKDLPRRRAAEMYRWRWRNEGLFRTFKRTLDKMKLRHRTPALVFREAEGALLALQVLLALTVDEAEAQRRRASPRRVLLRLRGLVARGLAGMGPRQRQRYEADLEQSHEENPDRTSAKVRRPFPRRKDHLPPKPPQFRRLTRKQKTLLAQTRAMLEH